MRRVKCDETKPACLKCTSTGRKCDGFETQDQKATRFINTTSVHVKDGLVNVQNGPASNAANSLRTSSPPVKSCKIYDSKDRAQESGLGLISYTALYRNPFLDIPGTPQEYRSLEFFHHYVAPALSGYFDSEFWTRLIPCIGASEPPIKHAMMALASLYKYQMNDEGYPTQEEQNFTLLQYNRAIRSLGVRLNAGEEALEITLLTCVLFICLEFMRGNQDVALHHLQGGLHILSTFPKAKRIPLSYNTETRTYTQPETQEPHILEDLVQIFSRLTIQTSLCSPLPPQLYPRKDNEIEDFTSACTPFATIQEARLSLDRILIECLRPSDSLTMSDVSVVMSTNQKTNRKKLNTQLRCWTCRYGLFTADSLHNFSSNEISGLRNLRMLSMIATIWNSTTLIPKETAFDDYVSQFETIISLAATFVNDEAASSVKVASAASCPSVPLTTSPPTLNTLSLTAQLELSSSFSSSNVPFTFEMGIIPCLYFTAIKCRCPSLRRKAIELLSKVIPQREGLWDSRMLGKVAARMMELEEDGCAPNRAVSTWPIEEKRIHGAYICPEYSVKGRTQQVTFAWRPHGLEGEWQAWTENIAY